jgi:hypothetical protein
MGFELLNRRSSRATGVAVNVHQAKGANAGTGLSGFFRVAPDVVRDAGWSEDTRLNILVGTDKDKGTFLLQPAPDGRTKPFKAKSGASLQVSFSAMSAGFKAPTEGSTEVDYSIEEGGTVKVTMKKLLG